MCEWTSPTLYIYEPPKIFLITSVVAGHHYCNKNVDLHYESVAVRYFLFASNLLAGFFLNYISQD